MALVLVGVNHKTCHLEIREQFFLQPTEKELLLAEFRNDPRVLAAVVLSTCNRTEIYVDLLDTDASIVLNIFFAVKHLPLSPDLVSFFYICYDKDVVAHLFRVASGLDSMILGEKQILGQVRDSLIYSQEKRMHNRTFNILSKLAIETGKKVRRETLIDFGGSSVSWAAVSRVQDILGSLEGRTVLVMGSGKMGNLAIQELRNKGAGKIYVMNRTHEKAEELAQQSGVVAVQYWQIREILEQSDVCICSTGAPHYIIDKELVELVMAVRPDKEFVAVDIAVPRNIDPQVASIQGVTLVSVDDLAQKVQDNINKRMAVVEQAEQIIRVKIDEFYRALEKTAAFEIKNDTGVGSRC